MELVRKSIFIALVFWVSMPSVQSQSNNDLIEKLNRTLLKKEKYVDGKLHTIANLRRRLEANLGASAPTKFDINNQLYHQYKSFVFDSAFHYANKLITIGYEMGDSSKIGYAKTTLGFTLLSAGMFKEAFDTLNTVRVKDLVDSAKVEYYALMARTLYDICDYNGDNFYCPRYVKNAKAYIDFGTSLAEPGSYHFLYLNGLRSLREERTDDALQYLNSLMEIESNLSGQRLAITVSTLSYLHLKLGDTTTAVNLLVSACISDIEGAVKETSAMTSLAKLLYDQGEMDYAYRYINESMNDAKYYGAIQRMSQVGHILPIISSAKLNDVEGQRKKLMIFSISLIVLVLVALTFTVVTIIQKKRISKRDQIIKENNDKLREAFAQLTESNKIKDEYLGFYIDLNSKYLYKMDKIKHSIESKLLDRQYDDIRYILRKANLKKEREFLFNNFDESFVKIFPHFIEKFNALFKEEDHFFPDKGQILNTELRIFALIRIGISDSERLASILGYSVNTIYAYKNRIKSQSLIANNEFDKRIMEISSS